VALLPLGGIELLLQGRNPLAAAFRGCGPTSNSFRGALGGLSCSSRSSTVRKLSDGPFGPAARTWLAEREADLLPVGYFHLVFTLPAEIADVAFQNKAAVYDLLFQAASETMLRIAADPKHLGARIGITAVLHTWGSALTHHPHVHMVVPGGGIALDGQRWIASRPALLLPVRVLGKLFRGVFLSRLLALYDAGRLAFFGSLAPLAARRAFLRHLAPVRKKRWAVYAKPPFAGPEAVLAYLSRYTNVSPSRTGVCSLSTRPASPSATKITGAMAASDSTS
jgi:hypothetical protein